MNWLSRWWRKPALKVQDPENSRRGKSDTWSGYDVGADGALRISTWWSGVRLYGETIGALPCAVYEKQADGSKKPNAGHWLYNLVHESPNSDQTAAEFWESVVIDLAVHGHAYSLKAKRDDKSIVSLAALVANGNWPLYGPWMRAGGALVGALIWSQMCLSLVLLALPSPGIPIYAVLTGTELFSIYRALAGHHGRYQR